MNIQHVTGRLQATNKEGINERTHHSIWLAANATNWYSLTDAPLWDHGIILIGEQKTVNDGDAAAKQLIDKIAVFIKEPGIPELELEGEIAVVITGEETIVYHVQVANNEAKYTKADLAWGKTKVA